MYESLGIDPREHFIIFSDNLTVDRAEKLQKQCDDIGMKGRYLDYLGDSGSLLHTSIRTSQSLAMFGIGTHFTNDFRTKSSGLKDASKPLNIVIKIASIDGKPCVKLSDEPTKVRGMKLTFLPPTLTAMSR